MQVQALPHASVTHAVLRHQALSGIPAACIDVQECCNIRRVGQIEVEALRNARHAAQIIIFRFSALQPINLSNHQVT